MKMNVYQAFIRLYARIEAELTETEDEGYAASLRLIRSELDGVLDLMEDVGLLEVVI